jgi:uncharacterized protein YaaW (UPF0174 family)
MKDRWLWPVLNDAREEDLVPLLSLLRTKNLKKGPRLVRKNPKDIQETLHDSILWAGGHSVLNRIRGHGPSYAQVVREAAQRLKIPYSPLESTIEVEERVATTVLNAMPECVTRDQFEELGDNLSRLHWPRNLPLWRGVLTMALFAGRFLGSGAQRLVAFAVEGGSFLLSAFGLESLAHVLVGGVTMFLLGQIGWVAMAIWTLFGLQGPSFRVTIPAVVLVSTIRAKGHGTARPIGFRE